MMSWFYVPYEEKKEILAKKKISKIFQYLKNNNDSYSLPFWYYDLTPHSIRYKVIYFIVKPLSKLLGLVEVASGGHISLRFVDLPGLILSKMNKGIVKKLDHGISGIEEHELYTSMHGVVLENHQTDAPIAYNNIFYNVFKTVVTPIVSFWNGGIKYDVQDIKFRTALTKELNRTFQKSYEAGKKGQILSLKDVSVDVATTGTFSIYEEKSIEAPLFSVVTTTSKTVEEKMEILPVDVLEKEEISLDFIECKQEETIPVTTDIDNGEINAVTQESGNNSISTDQDVKLLLQLVLEMLLINFLQLQDVQSSDAAGEPLIDYYSIDKECPNLIGEYMMPIASC